MSIKTLIIDDDEISVMLTEILIKDSPLSKEINTYSDGTFALEYLKAEYDVNATYVIILDINMPLMNGWEFLNEIKYFASQKNTYVFMLSSSTDKEDIEKADKTDLVKGFISKPIQKQDIKKIWDFVTDEK